MRFLLPIALVWFSSVRAADVPCPLDAADASITRPGHWSMQFGVTQHFRLTNADGMSLALVRDLDARRRISLGVRLGRNLYDSNTTLLWQGTDIEGDSTRIVSATLNQLVFTCAAQMQWLSPPTAGVSWLFGLGPSIEHGSRQDERLEWPEVLPDDILYFLPDDVQSRVTSVGALGTLGTEWRVSPSLALQADYSLSITRYWRQSRVRNIRSDYEWIVTRESRSGWSIKSQAVQLCLLLRL